MPFFGKYYEIIASDHAIDRALSRGIPLSVIDVCQSRTATKKEYTYYRGRHKEIHPRSLIRIHREGKGVYVLSESVDRKGNLILIVVTCIRCDPKFRVDAGRGASQQTDPCKDSVQKMIRKRTNKTYRQRVNSHIRRLTKGG